MVINTNVMSLNSQRQLSQSGNSVATAMERLSSGLRINSAKDDAAGLAISDRMTSQINGLNQAMRNANDGVSMAQVGEGAMQEVTNMLQRVRTLSIQSANGSNSTTDRASLQAEVAALTAEITRVADTTSFGTTKLFDGTFGTTSFQVGAQANETISITIDDISADQLGDQSGKTVTMTSYNATQVGDAAETLTIAVTDATGTYSLDVALAAGAGTQDLVDGINDALGSYGVNATNTAGALVLSTTNAVTGLTIASSVAADGGVFDTTAAAQTLGAADSHAAGSTVNNIDISTDTGAQDALAVIDKAIQQIDSKRADLGAFQNRMEHTIANLSNISENVSAARSRIQDADFAAETANLTRAQILQQAGVAMLAQANAAPQNVLSLLQ